MTIPVTMPITTFAVAFALEGEISAVKVFVSLSLFQSLVDPLMALSRLMQDVAMVYQSLRRIAEFLHSGYTNSTDTKPCNSQTENNQNEEIPVIIQNATWKYELPKEDGNAKEPFALTDIDLKLNKGLTYAILGPVGSGKTSFLAALNGDISLAKGYCSLTGKIAYCTQRPWIISGSIKKNILLQFPYDAQRLSTVLSVCGLEVDVARFPNGIDTIIGERG
jgi:ABC-type multidrug transport system fused ATPase/permease subunit